MDDLLPWIIAAVVVLVVFLVGRAKERREREPPVTLFGGELPEPVRRPAVRQERKSGEAEGTNLLGAGMLGLQHILAPESNVEILREEEPPVTHFGAEPPEPDRSPDAPPPSDEPQ